MSTFSLKLKVKVQMKITIIDKLLIFLLSYVNYKK